MNRTPLYLCLAVLGLVMVAGEGVAAPKGGEVVRFGSNSAGGRIRDVIKANDGSELYCTMTSIAGNKNRARCVARDSKGQRLVCTTDDPRLLKTIEKIDRDTAFVFTKRGSSSSCAYIRVTYGFKNDPFRDDPAK